MRSWKAISSGILVASFVVFAVPACTCPDDEVRVGSGTYESEGGTILAGPPAPQFPHGDEPKRMEVDRAAGLVHITYERDGALVSETWRIVASDVWP